MSTRRYFVSGKVLLDLMPYRLENCCRTCEECASRKGTKTCCREQMKQYLVGSSFERIAVNVMGPFPPAEAGNRYILVAMDYFSKWPEVAEVLVDNLFCRLSVLLAFGLRKKLRVVNI